MRAAFWYSRNPLPVHSRLSCTSVRGLILRYAAISVEVAEPCLRNNSSSRRCRGSSSRSNAERATAVVFEVARVVITTAADADAAVIFDDLYAKAGKSTVVKYRALFKKIYNIRANFRDSGPPRP